MSELEWTCENCKYENEDMEGTHCRHCIHNAVENFEPKEKEMTATEMKNNVIDEFAKRLKEKSIDMEHLGNDTYGSISWRDIDDIAKEMRGGAT